LISHGPFLEVQPDFHFRSKFAGKEQRWRIWQK
jgi:hypothetical protein